MSRDVCISMTSARCWFPMRVRSNWLVCAAGKQRGISCDKGCVSREIREGRERCISFKPARLLPPWEDFIDEDCVSGVEVSSS